MRKSVFRGIINGEEFTNVQDYNARMNELIAAGEVVEATSSTKVENVADEVPAPESQDASNTYADDEDLSFYPYMEDDDPFYLDLLVSTDTQQNAAALDEVAMILEKCKGYIVDTLEDEDVTCDIKVKYLEDIRDILESIDRDAESTVKARKSVLDKRARLAKEFEAVKEKYEQDIKSSLNEEILLNGAAPVIATLKSFYKDIETLVEENLADCQCKCGGGSGTCKCCKDEVPTTETREIEPTRVSDLSTLLETIFGPCGFRRNRLS